MRRILLLLIAITLVVVPAFAAKQRNWEVARVISQQLDAVGGGAISIPQHGAMPAAFHRIRRSNILVVETAASLMTWSEKGKDPIVLAVGSSIQFYRDGEHFVVLDSSGKKHKFALVAMSSAGAAAETHSSTNPSPKRDVQPGLSA